MWLLHMQKHRTYLVENFKSVNYDIIPLTYAETIKTEAKHYELSSVLQIKQTYMYKKCEN